ncbi:MAG TPA: hypothetical protein VLB76_12395 [Thermoanaerobaculia bacterium]|nr:hypothetical protein [Thermoanaerobaculia bacterium]
MAPWLCILPLFALGCNRQSPTEPASSPKVAAAATDDANVSSPGNSGEKARGGNGNGNGGNGNGGGGNGGGNGNGGNGGGNGNGGHGGDLAFQIEPATWNTNWVNASGNLQAFLRGGDAGKVDLGSILLAGGGGGKTLSPRSARYAGGQVVATFSKADAFDLLDNPKRGDTKTVTLRFSVAGAQKELTDSVRIVGDGGTGGTGSGGEEEGETRLSIDPDDWNTNWQHSPGTLHAFLRGGALAKVDLSTVRLVGDKAGAEPLEPTDVRRVGKQIAARFTKSAAYATLDDPHSGQHHMVKITFKADGKNVELTADVRIVGP